MHRDFRLWLTSAPSEVFPVSVLQAGIKMTNAPPRGLRASLLQTYMSMDDDALEDSHPSVALHRLTFSLCFFHALVLERRRFGSIGWNEPYRFTPEDLSICRRQLRMLVDESIDDDINYRVLVYLTANVNYGGKVTDEQDQLLIEAIAERCICRAAAEEDAYSFSASGAYHCPRAQSRQGTLDCILSLPTTTAPEAFGLHANAQIVGHQQASRDLLQGLCRLAPREPLTPEDGMQEAGPLQQAELLREQVPKPIDVKALRNHPVKYLESMNTVLRQEVLRCNRLLAEVKETLGRLEGALKGMTVMSEELEQVGASLRCGIVPSVWAEVGFLSMKPLKSWVKDVQERVRFFSQWCTRDPVAFSLAAFFFPQGFLSGILQNFARRYKTAFDKLSFSHRIQDMIGQDALCVTAPEDGCYVEGFFLEGCHFSGGSGGFLESSVPRELFCPMPWVWFLPVVSGETQLGVQRPTYRSPLYKVLSRRGELSSMGHSTNFVASVELPSREEPSTWALAGVALFLSQSS